MFKFFVKGFITILIKKIIRYLNNNYILLRFYASGENYLLVLVFILQHVLKLFYYTFREKFLIILWLTKVK